MYLVRFSANDGKSGADFGVRNAEWSSGKRLLAKTVFRTPHSTFHNGALVLLVPGANPAQSAGLVPAVSAKISAFLRFGAWESCRQGVVHGSEAMQIGGQRWES